jgi:hypothetical protein
VLIYKNIYKLIISNYFMRKEALLTFLILGVLLLSVSGVSAVDSIYDFTAETIMETRIGNITNDSVVLYFFPSEEYMNAEPFLFESPDRIEIIEEDTGFYIHNNEGFLKFFVLDKQSFEYIGSKPYVAQKVDGLKKGGEYYYYFKLTIEYRGSAWTQADNEILDFRSEKIKFTALEEAPQQAPDLCPTSTSLNLPEGNIGDIELGGTVSDSGLYYCDSDSTWKLVKSKGVACSEDYECDGGNCNSSNVCGEEITGGNGGGSTPTTVTNSCSDSDGGIDYFTKGTATFNGVDSVDSCVDENTIVEYYCDNSNVLQNTRKVLPIGWKCEEGAWVMGSSTSVCPEDSSKNLPGEIPIKTQYKPGSIIYYCDLDKTWNKAKSNGKECLADYECISNDCVDRECYSVRSELESQTNFIMRIYCIVTNLRSYLSEDNKENYESCIDEYLGQDMIDEIQEGYTCKGTPLACDSEFLKYNGQDCMEQNGCTWNGIECDGTATSCIEIGINGYGCEKQTGCQRVPSYYVYD